MSSSASAPAFSGLLGEVQRLDGVVRAGARDHGHVFDGVDDGLDDLDVFGVGERRRLAGRSHGDEAVDAGGFEPLGVLAERFCIDIVVLGKGGHHRREDPTEVDLCHGIGGWGTVCIVGRLCEASKKTRNGVATPAPSDHATRFFGWAGRTAIAGLSVGVIAVQFTPRCIP
jgi:hypothetical protein